MAMHFLSIMDMVDLLSEELPDRTRYKESKNAVAGTWVVSFQNAEEHPSRVASQHALTGAYRVDGQIKKAVGLLKHVCGSSREDARRGTTPTDWRRKVT